MGFTEAVSTCFSKYFTKAGRASRSEFWWFLLATLLSSITIIGPIFFFFPYVFVLARRLHDVGKSAWWVLILLLVPFVNLIGWIPLLIWTIEEGEPCANKWGPNPLAVASNGNQQSRRPQQATSQRAQQRQPNRPNPQPRPQTAYDYSAPRGGVSAASHFASEETEIVGGGYDRASNAVARLTVNGRQYTLRSGRNIIGRQGDTSEATVQIVTNDMYMSRQHCVITVIPQSDGRVSAKISNYQNKNKTMINGRILDSMKEVWLPNVCDITMGHTTVRYNA